MVAARLLTSVRRTIRPRHSAAGSKGLLRLLTASHRVCLDTGDTKQLSGMWIRNSKVALASANHVNGLGYGLTALMTMLIALIAMLITLSAHHGNGWPHPLPYTI